MTSKQFARFEGHRILGHRSAVGVFLKYLVDEAEASEHKDEPWLSDAVSHWRVQASIAEFGITLEEKWSSAQRQVFIILAEEACKKLATRESIPAEEVDSWRLVDGMPISGFGPGVKAPTAPIIELGQALIAVVSGKQPPRGDDWYYGLPPARYE